MLIIANIPISGFGSISGQFYSPSPDMANFPCPQSPKSDQITGCVSALGLSSSKFPDKMGLLSANGLFLLPLSLAVWLKVLDLLKKHPTNTKKTKGYKRYFPKGTLVRPKLTNHLKQNQEVESLKNPQQLPAAAPRLVPRLLDITKDSNPLDTTNLIANMPMASAMLRLQNGNRWPKDVPVTFH